MTFDTLAVANELKQAGFSQEQAEALAHAWGHVASGDLATKSDLLGIKFDLKEDVASVKSDLEKQIVSLRNELKEDIAAVRQDVTAVQADNRLLKWMVGFVLAISLIILGKLLILRP